MCSEMNPKTQVAEKILVAEDSPALANLLEYILTHAGFEVTLFRDGLLAWDAASQEAFDIIMLDQQMPGMTGLQVLQKLRQSGPNTNTPVFLCTAKTHELDLHELEAAQQITGIFHKPFSPKKLVERLKAVTLAKQTNS
jgi:two-component system alkaline phosphatase synthesis response regulator PhoP